MFISFIYRILPIYLVLILLVLMFNSIHNRAMKGSGIEFGIFGYQWALDLHKKNKKVRDEKNSD